MRSVRRRAQTEGETADCGWPLLPSLTHGWGRARSFHRLATHTRRHQSLAWWTGSEQRDRVAVQASAAEKWPAGLAAARGDPRSSFKTLFSHPRRRVNGQEIELEMSNANGRARQADERREASGEAQGNNRRS